MKITIAQAAEYLECSEERVTQLLREGQLWGVKMGKAWVIPTESFYAAVNGLAKQYADEIKAEAAFAAAEERRRTRPPVTIPPGGIQDCAVVRPRLFRTENI